MQKGAAVKAMNGNEILLIHVQQYSDHMPGYYTRPETPQHVSRAAFRILHDGDQESRALGVVFTPVLAVTCDHNFNELQTVGAMVSIESIEGTANVQVVARYSDLNFAILKSTELRPFVCPWPWTPEDLVGRSNLALGTYLIPGGDQNILGFCPSGCVDVSNQNDLVVHSCPCYRGDSGAALLVKDGFLVGIHLETTNMARERLQRKKLKKEALTDTEKRLERIVSSGRVQASFALLMHRVKAFSIK